ncbi:MAG: hypothetical protein R3C68_08600 [Myxococcota bacterium]
MPHPLLIPSYWLATIHSLPRTGAIAVLLLCLSMLALGLWGRRLYLLTGIGCIAWLGGSLVAKQMHVTTWYVALPVLLMVTGLFWRKGWILRLTPWLSGFLTACIVGQLMALNQDIVPYWAAFICGLIAGAFLGAVARRFTTVLLFACLGSFGVLASLGAVVRAPGGVFAPGAYDSYPTIFLVTATAVILMSMLVQITLDPEV